MQRADGRLVFSPSDLNHFLARGCPTCLAGGEPDGAGECIVAFCGGGVGAGVAGCSMTTNPFVSIVLEAVAREWCTRPFCTTCGAREYRLALRDLGGPVGERLCDALCELSPAELVELPNWAGALEIAVRDLPMGTQVEAVLRAWLPRIGEVVPFDDVVLFRIVRCLRETGGLREEWIRAAIPVAVRTKDHSLVETLLLVMRPEAARSPELVAVAQQLAVHSKQMRRVLRNVGVGES